MVQTVARRNVNGRVVAAKVAEAMENKKGWDVAVLKMTDLTSVCDYFVVCSGTTTRQVKAIAKEIVDATVDSDLGRPLHREGIEDARWVLLDYGDVVAHIFLEDQREFYNLEHFWGDAYKEPLPMEA